ncbi:MAG: ABC transporter permease [Bacteroidales bacterium]|jgi:putative ABC transport system permease protein|nr:ABC transporter permease [Bacteroidales bacterium]MDD2205101.1 ABC transporter permease [Bacteroidales bacterium]MDD3152312.1 ABC transporter permease [Bacteroidales bacterium]MDD3914583.1 ABC transporter permease [Bacteroidales bacterium]MDD4634472.1 ABC transporter permease [Bacteroidales bacterium]
MNFGIFDEIATSLKRNKARTFLTGFSVAWGIFMLIILLAAGNGLKNGVSSDFEDRQVNVLAIWTWQSTIPYQGYSTGRKVSLYNEDSSFIANNFPETDQVIPSYNVGYKTIGNGRKQRETDVQATISEYEQVENIKIVAGRFINKADVKEKRKVAVLSKKDADLLYPDGNIIGRNLIMDGIVYTIVGYYGGEVMSWRTTMYVPYSTAMEIYSSSNEIESITCSLNGLTTAKANENFNTRLREGLSLRLKISPLDKRALGIWNQLEEYLQTQQIFKAISTFIWIIGIGTLIAGIVGISNIMLITVRERTKEFGIRKSIGAKPMSIIKLIITESLLITGVFGYIGMITGIAVTEAVNKFMPVGGSENGVVFKNPTVDLKIVIAATIVLIIAGVLAGYFPARKAVKIKPIEALRYE